VPTAIEYDVEGLEPIEHHLLGIGERAIETRPMLEMFAADLEAQMSARFEAEGEGDWAPLADSTVARKGSSVIGRETDAMMNSLTDSGAEGSLREIFGDELVFGTNLVNDDGFPYPVVFNDGSKTGQPARPLFNLAHLDLRRFSKLVQTYLIAGDRSEFGVGSFGMGLTVPFGA
jgi:phage gpG-like protein